MVANAGAGNLGQAEGRIIIDASGVRAGMEEAQRTFRGGITNIGRGISGLGNQIAGIGASLSTITAPVALFGATGVRAAARFEDALVEIQTRAGLTDEELERVRQKALEIGRDTAFGAGQGAEAFLQLLTTGQSVEEAFGTIDTVIAGAAASGENLGFVADALTDIMAQFNTQGATSGDVLTAITAASGSSSATVSDLVQGFQNAGGVAASFGLSVGEAAAILATFSENGIKGANAGTQLRSMLNNLNRDTDDVQETWNRLNISLFEASGEARPLGDVMQELRVALEGMSDQERVTTVQTLAGTFGQLGLNALTTGASMEDMLAQMDGAASASEIAEARMSTFRGALTFLKGSVETLQINALTPLMNNALAPMVRMVAGVVNGVNEWVTANPELAAQIVQILGVVVALGPALFIAGKAMAAFGAVLTLALSPLGLAAILVGALVAAYVTNFGGMRDFIDGVVRPALVGFIVNEVIPGLQAWIDMIGVARPRIEAGLQGIRNFIDNVVIPGLEAWVGIIEAAWPRIQAALGPIGEFFVLVFDEVISPALLALGELFAASFAATVGIIEAFINATWNTFVGTVRAVWGLVRGDLGAFRDGVKQVFDAVKGFIEDAIRVVGDFVTAITSIPDIDINLPSAGGILNSLNPLRKFATGGIVTGPTPALIGEALGAGEFEAVLTSPQLKALLEEVRGSSGGGMAEQIVVQIPPGAISPSDDPEAQGQAIGRGILSTLRSRGN